ncbi:cytochrome c oxidase assembly protein [Neobacillus drentensis]|uniref:cytochrome c oxidase assembly protein n=1 Tax=Neobacillus drentensis TaxID=220684 RepID=UPI002FFEA159
MDPAPHRYGFVFRAVVLILSLAAHGILSKYIYAHPPVGVPSEQSETGGMIMYYGGDMVEIVLIFLFC